MTPLGLGKRGEGVSHPPPPITTVIDNNCSNSSICSPTKHYNAQPSNNSMLYITTGILICGLVLSWFPVIHSLLKAFYLEAIPFL